MTLATAVAGLSVAEAVDLSVVQVVSSISFVYERGEQALSQPEGRNQKQLESLEVGIF